MSNANIKSHLELAIKSDEHFYQAHYELAKIFLEEKNVQSAIKSLKNAIKSGLKGSLASKNRGQHLINKEQFPQAKRHMFKMGISRYDTSVYFFKLAQIYLELDNLKNAKKYALYSLEQYKNQHLAMQILGYVYTSNNQWKKAVNWFTKSLELNYKDAKTHLSLAKVKQQQKNQKKAVHHYLIAKDIDKSISSISLDKLSKKHPEL